MSSPESSEDGEHTPPPHAAIMPILIQVGEQRFVTTKETMQESGFFAVLFSECWGENTQADGSYFVDGDPQLFEHILRYLRRGVLPIFYDDVKGHDHDLYLTLLQEAKFYQIPRLEDWLMDEEYNDAVKIMYSADTLEGTCWSETRNTGEKVEYHPTWQMRKVFICPRGIRMHRGDPSSCATQCNDARGNEPDKYEEQQVMRTIVIRKETIVDQAAFV